MFKAYDVSIAMGNAPLSVRENADLVIDHHNSNGLTKFLQYFYKLKCEVK